MKKKVIKKVKKDAVQIRQCVIVIGEEFISKRKVENAFKKHPGLKHFVGILHDKDVYLKSETDLPKGKKIGDLKNPHFHIYISLNNPRRIENIAAWFKIKPQYIQKIKTNKVFNLRYLTHLNAPEKYQYDDKEVWSNYDWITDRNSTILWSDNHCWKVLKKVATGEMRRHNQFDFISLENYNKHKSKVNDAFEYQDLKLSTVDKDMQVIWIYGDGDMGKTVYAKDLALSKFDHKPYIASFSNDYFGKYGGQDCVIIDDLKPKGATLEFMVKTLDNNTGSAVQSRYYNKVLQCKLIIITSVYSMEQFFKKLQEQENVDTEREDVIQLKRRCIALIEITKDKIYTREILKDSRKYSLPLSKLNYIKKVKFNKPDNNLQQSSEYLNYLLQDSSGHQFYLDYQKMDEVLIEEGSNPQEKDLPEQNDIFELAKKHFPSAKIKLKPNGKSIHKEEKNNEKN